ncbi:hypothetical protein RJ55_07935 [Drechmeria coniospora]|nr:hypothetical protein RJ55_07935 [Drechmeria coniospora]
MHSLSFSLFLSALILLSWLPATYAENSSHIRTKGLSRFNDVDEVYRVHDFHVDDGVYRFDTRSFLEVQEQGGFKPWGATLDDSTRDFSLYNFITKNGRRIGTMFTKAWTSINVALLSQYGREGFIYQIATAGNGIDVRKSLGPFYPTAMQGQDAIAYIGGIHKGQIIAHAYVPKDFKGTAADLQWIPNPDFDASTYGNRLLTVAPQLADVPDHVTAVVDGETIRAGDAKEFSEHKKHPSAWHARKLRQKINRLHGWFKNFPFENPSKKHNGVVRCFRKGECGLDGGDGNPAKKQPPESRRRKYGWSSLLAPSTSIKKGAIPSANPGYSIVVAGGIHAGLAFLNEARKALGQAFVQQFIAGSRIEAMDAMAGSSAAFDRAGDVRVGGFYRHVFERPDDAPGGLDELNRRRAKQGRKFLTRAQLYQLALHQDQDKHMGVEAYNEFLREQGDGVLKTAALREYWENVVKIYPALDRYRQDFLEYGQENPWEPERGTRCSRRRKHRLRGRRRDRFSSAKSNKLVSDTDTDGGY